MEQRPQPLHPPMETLAQALRVRAYARLPDTGLAPLLMADPPHWRRFQDSWERLCLDKHMADGGRYRYRRYSIFHWTAANRSLALAPHRPHYQESVFNPVHGGIHRHYPPMEPDIRNNPVFRGLVGFCMGVLEAVAGAVNWYLEVHQFRILALPSGGHPTPEGIHQDGVDYNFILLVNRSNAAGGETGLYDLKRRPLDGFTLEQPGDGLLADDRRIMHGVSPIMPRDPQAPGYRDVLVVTFRQW